MESCAEFFSNSKLLVSLPFTRLLNPDHLSCLVDEGRGNTVRTILRVENRDLKGAVEGGSGNANARRCPHTAFLAPLIYATA